MENAADAVFDHEREEKMHLLKQEWKKLVTRDGFLAVFLQLHQSRCNSASCDYHHKHSCEDFLYLAHEDHLIS